MKTQEIKTTNDTTIEMDVITTSCSSYSDNSSTGKIQQKSSTLLLLLSCNFQSNLPFRFIYRQLSSWFDGSLLLSTIPRAFLLFRMVPYLEIYFCSEPFSSIHNIILYNLGATKIPMEVLRLGTLRIREKTISIEMGCSVTLYIWLKNDQKLFRVIPK